VDNVKKCKLTAIIFLNVISDWSL